MASYAALEAILSNEETPYPKKLRSLNAFISQARKDLSSSSSSEKETFLASIPSTTSFGQKVRLELANTLRLFPPICEIWTSGSTLFLTRTFQFNWLFQEGPESPLLSDPNFLPDLFPQLSYSFRRKLLTKMGKFCGPSEAEKVTEIYQKIESLFGSDTARLLLPACSQSLLDSLIEKKEVKFSHHEVLIIYRKYPTSILKYLELLYQDLQAAAENPGGHIPFFTAKDACNLLLSIMGKRSPEDFMNLYEKYGDQIRLSFGPNLSNFFLKDEKLRKRILAKPALYFKLLHQDELLKRLSESELDASLPSLFPDDISSFPSDFEGWSVSGLPPLHSFIENRRIPPQERFAKLDSAFAAKYDGKSILSFPDFISSRILQLIPGSERDRWVDLRISGESSGKQSSNYYLYTATSSYPAHVTGYWEAFRTTDKSIPKIKQFLSTESDHHRRGDLLSSLVLTCSVNKDFSSLKEVCNFVSTRYRNDNIQVHVEFLSTLNTSFNLLSLDEETWKPINELLHIFSLNNETCRLPLLEVLLEKSIHFRLKRGLPVDTQIQHYIKMKIRSYCRGESWCLATQDSAIERKALTLFAEQLTSLFPLSTPCPSDSSSASAIISLFESFSGFNRRNRRKGKEILLSASDYPWFMKRLQDVLESYHDGNKERVNSALNNDLKTKELLLSKVRNEADPNATKQYAIPSVLTSLWKEKPSLLASLMDNILDFLLQSNKINEWRSFLKLLNCAGMPKLCEAYGNKCLSIAEDEEESLKERKNAVYILSFLLSPENYVDWTSRFYPPEDQAKLDLTSTHYTEKEMEALYTLRKTVAESFSNLTKPSAAISALPHFLRGDYLKFTVGSLLSISVKSPPSQVQPFLKEMAGRPVSVKKHAIRLMLLISKKEETIAFLSTLWNEEKHYSIRTILFSQIFQFFLTYRSDEAWNLLTDSIQSLTENDHPFMIVLGNRYYVTSKALHSPKLSDYLKLALDRISFIGQTHPQEAGWTRVDLLLCITASNISFIEESVLSSLFEQHLFLSGTNSDLNFEPAIRSVAINYLLHYDSDQRVPLITKYLERLLGSEWFLEEKEGTNLFPARQVLSYFLEHLTKESFAQSVSTLKQALKAKETLTAIQAFLRSKQEVHYYFVDDLFLSFGILFLPFPTTENDDFSPFLEIGKKLGKMIDEIPSEIISIFLDTLKRFLSLRLKGKDGVDGTKMMFIGEGVLDSTGSVPSQILASQLILGQFSTRKASSTFQQKFLQLRERLRGIKNKTVQIFINYNSRPITERQC